MDDDQILRIAEESGVRGPNLPDALSTSWASRLKLLAFVNRVTEQQAARVYELESQLAASRKAVDCWRDEMGQLTKQLATMTARLEAAERDAERGRRVDWSWIRRRLSQGGDIWLDHQGKSHEMYSIRLDAAARELDDELNAIAAEQEDKE